MLLGDSTTKAYGKQYTEDDRTVFGGDTKLNYRKLEDELVRKYGNKDSQDFDVSNYLKTQDKNNTQFKATATGTSKLLEGLSDDSNDSEKIRKSYN